MDSCGASWISRAISDVRRDLARELADPEISNLLTGESKTMEERAPPPSMGEGTARRNSVSGQNIEDFTSTYAAKN